MVYGNNYGNTLNNFTPGSMQPTIPAPQPQPIAPLSSNIILVQGEAGAKGFLVSANNEVVLFDTENPIFYKKVATPNGISFRKFRYEEILEDPTPQSPIMSTEPQRKPLNVDTSQLVTWNALEDALPALVLSTIKQISQTNEEVNKDGKSNNAGTTKNESK